jgi:2-keto-3-deoxy-L-fuconate dehydrogenase
MLDQGRTEPAAFDYEHADVTDDAPVRRTPSSAVEQLGQLDLLVNNVGIRAVDRIEDNNDDESRSVLDVSVLHLVRATRAAPQRSRCPAIMNVTSITATAAVPPPARYSATEGAVTRLRS